MLTTLVLARFGHEMAWLRSYEFAPLEEFNRPVGRMRAAAGVLASLALVARRTVMPSCREERQPTEAHAARRSSVSDRSSGAGAREPQYHNKGELHEPCELRRKPAATTATARHCSSELRMGTISPG